MYLAKRIGFDSKYAIKSIEKNKILETPRNMVYIYIEVIRDGDSNSEEN